MQRQSLLIARSSRRQPVSPQVRWTRIRRRISRLIHSEGWTKLAGLATALAAVGALLYTGQAQKATQDQFSFQYKLSERGQYTERFGRAVEQLGSPTIDVRLGGVYSLSQLGRDSVEDRQSIAEVLVAFTRLHGAKAAEAPAIGECPGDRGSYTAPDIAAAISAIGRLSKLHTDAGSFDFGRLCLRKVDLASAILPNSVFEGSMLEQARFEGAILRDSDLSTANFKGANLRNVDAVRASFPYSNLQGATLAGANLTEANFETAELQRANFTGSNLSGASLTNARANGADFTRANLTGALFSYAGVHAQLNGANFNGANMTGVDLSQVDLTGVDLTGAYGYTR